MVKLSPKLGPRRAPTSRKRNNAKNLQKAAILAGLCVSVALIGVLLVWHVSTSEVAVAVMAQPAGAQTFGKELGMKGAQLMKAQQGIQQDCPEEAAFCSTCTSIVVLCHNRPSLLENCVKTLLQLRGVEQYHVVISQDGDDKEVAKVAQAFARKYDFIRHVHNEFRDEKKDHLHMIADHYKFVFTLLFERELGINHAILLKDDMQVSPDFLLYFESTAPILDQDSSVFAVSSWNDNGYGYMDLDPERLVRTRWFPGLGWMLRKRLWVEELKDKWPAYNWDHWLRVDDQLKGRDCIVPELSRNRNVGAVGTNSNPEVHARLLGNISSSSVAVTSFGDTSYLDRRRYFMDLKSKMQSSVPYSPEIGFGEPGAGTTYRLGYVREEFMALSEKFGLYPSDWPRGQFDHVTIFRRNGNTFLLYDRRQSTLCPPDDRIDLPDDFQQQPGEPGLDCKAVCGNKGATCDPKSFDFINHCEYLHQSFPCKGCDFKFSAALPGYVAGSGQCVVTDTFPTCEARDPEVSRLCSCLVEPGGPGGEEGSHG